MTLELERPLRYPDTGSAPLMTKRARWLVLLGFVLPGSAQVLAGSRRLGRLGLIATFTLLALGVLTIVGLSFARAATLTVLTNSIVLFVVQWLLVAYAVLWLVLGFDTLRLTRLVRVTPSWRVPVTILAVLLTVLPTAGALWASNTVSVSRGALSEIFGGGAPAVAPIDGRYNILLLGVDPGADREGMRPDSISMVSVNAETGQSIIIGLPRELTEMPFPADSPLAPVFPEGYCTANNNYVPTGDGLYCFATGYLNGLITEVEVSGSPSYAGIYPDAVSRGSTPGIEAMKDAVSGATGLTAQFYVMIDMEGFSSLIDALGGVTIDVTQPIPVGGYEDPDTGEWVDGDSFIPVGTHHMDGPTALMYARVRHGLQNGDYDRMQHQRQLQAAILAQMDPLNVLQRFSAILETGSDMVKTDIPSSMLGSFVDLAAKAKAHTPLTVQLTPPTIDPEYPDYALIHQMIADAVVQTSPVVPEE